MINTVIGSNVGFSYLISTICWLVGAVLLAATVVMVVIHLRYRPRNSRLGRRAAILFVLATMSIALPFLSAAMQGRVSKGEVIQRGTKDLLKEELKEMTPSAP